MLLAPPPPVQLRARVCVSWCVRARARLWLFCLINTVCCLSREDPQVCLFLKYMLLIIILILWGAEYFLGTLCKQQEEIQSDTADQQRHKAGKVLNASVDDKVIGSALCRLSVARTVT